MIKNNSIQYIATIVMGCLILMIQACAPTATLKKPETSLPETYNVGLQQDKPATQDQTNTADVNWKSFFNDPDLLYLIETALANNKEIKITQQRVNVAENEIQERKGEYLPFVGVGAGADVEKVSHYTMAGAAEESLHIIYQEGEGGEEIGEPVPKYLANYEFGLFASWEIDIWKKLRNSAKVAALEYMASKEGNNFLVTNMVAEIAHLYYELVALDNHFMNLEQNINLQNNGLEAVKQLKQYGRATFLAIKRYEAEVSKNRSHVYEVMQEMVEVENKINLLLGREPQPISRSSGGFLNMNPQVIQPGIPSQLLKNRPDIRRAELELTAATLNIDVARADFYPSLEINSRLGYEAFQTQYLFSPEAMAFSLAGEIAAPIFNRSAIIAQFKNANARQIQVALDYEQTILNAYTEVANKISNMSNLEKNYQLKTEQVNALIESIDLSNQLFTSGRTEYLEVLLTQREALEAKMELIETKQMQLSATVDLYRALGGGWK